jgi:hypothetical protein
MPSTAATDLAADSLAALLDGPDWLHATGPAATGAGHQVMGRRRKAGKKVWMPASEWIWSAEPSHTPPVDMATWDAAQRTSRRHGNVRDPEMPSARTGRRYKLRSRLYCFICHRRLSGTTIRAYTYYRCPHDPGLPRRYASTSCRTCVTSSPTPRPA